MSDDGHRHADPSARRTAAGTPDSHDFPTRPYDLVKEFVIALVVVSCSPVALAAIFSSPDEKAITMRTGRTRPPTTWSPPPPASWPAPPTSATYGPPYNHAAAGQTLLGMPLQKWGGVRLPVELAATWCCSRWRAQHGARPCRGALRTWRGASPSQQHGVGNGVRRRAGQRARTATRPRSPPGDYGPVPVLAAGFLGVARSGGLEGVADLLGQLLRRRPDRGRCCCSPTAPTSRTPPSPSTSAATSGA